MFRPKAVRAAKEEQLLMSLVVLAVVSGTVVLLVALLLVLDLDLPEVMAVKEKLKTLVVAAVARAGL